MVMTPAIGQGQLKRLAFTLIGKDLAAGQG